MNSKDTRIVRPYVEEIDEILGEKFPVLSDGFIRVIDYMGNDEAIVQAARVSYGRGTKKTSDDRALIRRLMRDRHTSPFEMAGIKLHVRTPMDVWRQWIRHRTASVNEYSTRYSEAINSTETTAPEAWRTQSTKNKQGSGEFLPEEVGKQLTQAETDLQKYALQTYRDRLELNVAREQARKDLPLSTYTEAYWKIDLHNLLHFLNLRMAPEAQKEIRSYADIIGNNIVARWVPLVWEAFQDYRLKSRSFSAVDKRAIRLIASGIPPYSPEVFSVYGSEYPSKFKGEHPKHTEISELLEKIKEIGLEGLLH